MKSKGLTNKLHAGKDPFERHGFARFGDEYDSVVAQTLGFIDAVIRLEADADETVRHRLRRAWNRDIFPQMEAELRKAVKHNDGSFFRSLALHAEKRGQAPCSAPREWITRLFYGVSDENGVRWEQYHTDRTSAELHAMFRHDCKRDPTGPETFTDLLKEYGVRYRKAPVGRPKRNSGNKTPP